LSHFNTKKKAKQYFCQDYCAFGFCPSSVIFRNTVIQKLDEFPSSSERVEDTYAIESVTKTRPKSMAQWLLYTIVRTLRIFMPTHNAEDMFDEADEKGEGSQDSALDIPFVTWDSITAEINFSPFA
jgi:hypothetical protein